MNKWYENEAAVAAYAQAVKAGDKVYTFSHSNFDNGFNEYDVIRVTATQIVVGRKAGGFVHEDVEHFRINKKTLREINPSPYGAHHLVLPDAGKAKVEEQRQKNNCKNLIHRIKTANLNNVTLENLYAAAQLLGVEVS